MKVQTLYRAVLYLVAMRFIVKDTKKKKISNGGIYQF
jgi:hypothetical protein